MLKPALGPKQLHIHWVPSVKWQGRDYDHSPPCSAEVRNAWSYTSTSLYVSMLWCLIKHRTKLHGVALGEVQGHIHLFPFQRGINIFCLYFVKHMRVYPKVSGLALWSENCK
jgi:hypothetical protein